MKNIKKVSGIKISCLKFINDITNFKALKALGVNVLEIENLEQTDEKIESLINQNYNTIILSNEVAGFSQNIITKYNKSKDVNIIIVGRK